jgi:predicted component of type VI protein secretion system
LGRELRLGGCAVVIGSMVFDRTAKFRISLGPLDIDTYRSLLPDLNNYLLLRNILCAYINEPLICELEISCYLRDLDPARLAESSNKPEKTGGLGRTTVLGRKRDGNGDDEIHRYRTIIFEKFIVPASPPRNAL